MILSDSVVINQDFIRAERQSGNALTRSLNGLILVPVSDKRNRIICEREQLYGEFSWINTWLCSTVEIKADTTLLEGATLLICAAAEIVMNGK